MVSFMVLDYSSPDSLFSFIRFRLSACNNDLYIKLTLFDPFASSYFYVLKMDSSGNFYNSVLVDSYHLVHGVHVLVRDPLANVLSASRAKIVINSLHFSITSALPVLDFISLGCDSFSNIRKLDHDLI